MVEIKELNKEDIMKNAELLIEEFDQLNIIYLRVSTKNEGQEESDQLPDIISTYDLKVEECLVIVAKESAYQDKKDKTRRFNIVRELIELYKVYDKTLYVWDLDRIYRNQDKQAQFISYFAHENNCKVLSYRQKYFHKFKEMGGMGKALYNFMIEIFGWMAEEESRKKGDRLKKSLTFDDKIKRFKTNKGNIFGKKLVKKIYNEGKRNERKIYYKIKDVHKIESIIIKMRKKNVSYTSIIKKFKDNGISISQGFISNVVKRNN